MVNLIEKTKILFQHRPRLIAGSVVVLALSLPFVINQVLKQQDIRQHASAAPSITLNFADPTQSVHVGDTVVLALRVNAGTNDIGAIHYKMTYPTGYAGSVTTSVAGGFTSVAQTSPDGTFETTLINSTNNQNTGDNLDVIKFQFTALKVGEPKFTVSDLQVTASKYNTYVPVDNSSNIIADITITENTTAVVDNCPASNKPDDCACAVNSDCASNNCVSANTGVASAVDGINGVCKPSTTTSPSQSPSPSPTADCNATAYRQNGCTCDSNPVCFSNYCIGTGTIPKTCQNPGWTPPVTSASPSPTPVDIACSTSGTSVTYNMKSPISGKTSGTITGITLTSGNWCAWAAGNDDPNSQGRCPLSCPILNPPAGTTSVTPLSLSTDKMSFTSAFDSYYSDNTGSCTYKVTCTTVTSSPTATATQVPTGTIPPGETALKVSVKLPGIGNENGNNPNPKRTNRTVTAIIYDSTNHEVPSTTGTVTYNHTTGTYDGQIGVGALDGTQSYHVKLKLDNTLYKFASTFVSITKGGNSNSVPLIKLISGDIDQDNHLRVNDYTSFLSCFQGNVACTGAVATGADINDNGSAEGDNDDMNILQRNFDNIDGD